MPDWLTARPVAHRGLHDASAGVIENTATAFTAAMAGRYAIECDLQISADGEAMVHHDAVLGRLTEGEGRIDALTVAELRSVPFRASSDRILSLGELCDLVAGRATLVIELKSRFDGDLRLAKRAATVLAGYTGAAAVMSFDPEPMTALHQLAPKLRRGLVAQRGHRGDGEHSAMSAMRFAARIVAARLDFLAYRVQDLDGFVPRVARHMFRLAVLTWTVRTPADLARAARRADQIIFEGFRP